MLADVLGAFLQLVKPDSNLQHLPMEVTAQGFTLYHPLGQAELLSTQPSSRALQQRCEFAHGPSKMLVKSQLMVFVAEK